MAAIAKVLLFERSSGRKDQWLAFMGGVEVISERGLMIVEGRSGEGGIIGTMLAHIRISPEW